MFEISFTEVLVIATVALVVIGPERLPKVARTLGHLFGRAQRYVNDVKTDIQHEMELEELKKWKASVEEAGQSIENTVRTELGKLQQAAKEETKPFGSQVPTSHEDAAITSRSEAPQIDSSGARETPLSSSHPERSPEREQK
jgi:sec-independent protein translocase protein TatB